MPLQITIGDDKKIFVPIIPPVTEAKAKEVAEKIHTGFVQEMGINGGPVTKNLNPAGFYIPTKGLDVDTVIGMGNDFIPTLLTKVGAIEQYNPTLERGVPRAAQITAPAQPVRGNPLPQRTVLPLPINAPPITPQAAREQHRAPAVLKYGISADKTTLSVMGTKAAVEEITVAMTKYNKDQKPEDKVTIEAKSHGSTFTASFRGNPTKIEELRKILDSRGALNVTQAASQPAIAPVQYGVSADKKTLSIMGTKAAVENITAAMAKYNQNKKPEDQVKMEAESRGSIFTASFKGNPAKIEELRQILIEKGAIEAQTTPPHHRGPGRRS